MSEPGLAPDFVARYLERTRRSRELAHAARRTATDTRSSLRLRPEWAELIYQIACPQSRGCRLWDVDGNDYVDLTMGFGVHLFGHRPDFVNGAVAEALGRGWHLGTEVEDAARAAELVCELTGMDRALFVATGSEAVHAALRVARTVTGRSKVAVFSNSYHGWFDTQFVQPAGDGRAAPVAPGTAPGATLDIIALPYGDEEAAQRLADPDLDLAAIVVEPIRAREPGVQRPDFLRALRRIADATGAALVFDEMVTGFRVAVGGAQELFGIRADLACYGKVVGGGMPIGVVAGRRRYMDAADGGADAFRDLAASAPRTIISGTYARHPLTMAAAVAVLERVRDDGPRLLAELEARSACFAEGVAQIVERYDAPLSVESCASIVRVAGADEAFREKLSYYLVHSGVFACEVRTWFLSTAHADADVDEALERFEAALRGLVHDEPARSPARGAPHKTAPHLGALNAVAPMDGDGA